MNRKMYRLCLVMVIMAAVVSGILYYRVLKKKIILVYIISRESI